MNKPGIKRLLTTATAVTTAMLTVAAGVPAATAASALNIDRIAGADRYSTSAEISKLMPPKQGGTVYLASGSNYPDALAAAPVALADNANLLLTYPYSLQPSTEAELRRLNPSKVITIGGTTTVTEAVTQRVQQILPAVRQERIAGTDRTHTSLLLADRLESITGRQATHAWVVNGAGFADALAVGPVAAIRQQPIILAGGDPTAFVNRLEATSPNLQQVYIAGGTTNVSAATQTALQQQGITVTRYAGANRYDTAVKINQAFPVTAGSTRFILVSGEKFPDGLAAAQLAARTGATMYLSPSQCYPGNALREEATRIGITRVTGIGDQNSLSDNALRLTPCP